MDYGKKEFFTPWPEWGVWAKFLIQPPSAFIANTEWYSLDRTCKSSVWTLPRVQLNPWRVLLDGQQLSDRAPASEMFASSKCFSPSYSVLPSYTSGSELCCCYPAQSYKSYSAPTCRRLTGLHSNWPRYKLTQVLSWITLFALLLFQCIYLLFVRRGDFALFSRCLERRSLHSWKDRRYVRDVPAFKLSWRRGRDGEDHRGWQTSKSTSYSFPPHHICETCFPSYLQQFQLM